MDNNVECTLLLGHPVIVCYMHMTWCGTVLPEKHVYSGRIVSIIVTDSILTYAGFPLIWTGKGITIVVMERLGNLFFLLKVKEKSGNFVQSADWKCCYFCRWSRKFVMIFTNINVHDAYANKMIFLWFSSVRQAALKPIQILHGNELFQTISDIFQIRVDSI